jgi:uncharacterized membrane protein YfcA
MWAGTWVGERMSNRVSVEVFQRILAALLLASGVSLVWKA